MLQQNNFKFTVLTLFFFVGLLKSDASILESHHSHHIPDSRIIGGHPVDNRPAYIVRVDVTDHNTEEQVQCGGILISEWHVLTTGRCVRGNRAVDKVNLGPYQYYANKESFELVKYGGSIVRHPGFGAKEFTHDLAIIKFETKIVVESTYYIKVAPLPEDRSADRSYVGETVETYGWGLTNDNPITNPSRLMGVNLTIIDLARCYSQMDQSSNPYEVLYLHPYEFCTSGVDGINDPRPVGTCHGDSGVPLIYRGTVIGIRSRGPTQDCSHYEPSVFVNIGLHLNWIRDQIKHF